MSATSRRNKKKGRKTTASANPAPHHKCPWCHKPAPAVNGEARTFRCGACLRMFEPEDDGDYSDRNPAARMEREERRRVRKN